MRSMQYHGRIILKWVFRKWDVGALTELFWSRAGKVCGDGLSGSINCVKFLD